LTIKDLQACGDIRSQIESLDERIARLRSQAERLSRPLTGLPGIDAGDFLAEYAAKLDELELERVGQVITLEEQLQTCEDWIATLPTRQAKVMRLRYIDGLPWKQVAQEAHYGIRHCSRIHTAAIKKMSNNVLFFCDKV
jgi:RNA polymerase sigma factor (sigma-70 family)